MNTLVNYMEKIRNLIFFYNIINEKKEYLKKDKEQVQDAANVKGVEELMEQNVMIILILLWC